MMELLATTWTEFVKYVPIVIVAVVISQIINVLVPKKKMGHKFLPSEKNIAETAAAGVLTPGPLLAYLPLLKTLNSKGLDLSIIVTFITAQTLIGPARLILEVGYFGLPFFIGRLVLALMIATAIGTCFKYLEKKIKF